MYEVQAQTSGEKLAGSNDRKTAIELAVMLAIHPVRLDQTWSSKVVDTRTGHIVATVEAET